MSIPFLLRESTETPKLFKKCPYCNKEVKFLPVKGYKDVYYDLSEYSVNVYEAEYMGLRKCSNPSCEMSFNVKFKIIANEVVWDETGNMNYKQEIIDLETLPQIDYCIHLKHLPENIEKTFIEAQKCFYNRCYTASAIMIRKTLEELCEDKKIKGKNLKDKIANLCNSGISPIKLHSDVDELRKLGNDGAHIILKDFNDIGEKEAEAALEIIENVLRIVYESNQNYKNSIFKLKKLKSISKD